MTTCSIIAAVITCVFSGPAPKPAESAALLAPRQYVHVPRTIGPTVSIVSSDPTHGPYGPLTVTAPRVRLDGSRWEDPPWQATIYLDRRNGRGRDRSSVPVSFAVR